MFGKVYSIQLLELFTKHSADVIRNHGHRNEVCLSASDKLRQRRLKKFETHGSQAYSKPATHKPQSDLS